MNWAHIHLMLTHLPVIGAIFGVSLLLIGLLKKSEGLKRQGLVISVVTALLALPVYFTGEPAEEMVENLPGVTETLIERHETVALYATLMAGLTAVFSLISLIRFRRAEKLPGWIVAAALILSLATSGLMGWTANLGGLIRHTEVRSEFKAPAETGTEHERKSEEKEKEK